MVINWPIWEVQNSSYGEQQHFLCDELLIGTSQITHGQDYPRKCKWSLVQGAAEASSSAAQKLNSINTEKQNHQLEPEHQDKPPRGKNCENWAAPLETSRSHNAQCPKPKRVTDINHWIEDPGVIRIMRIVQPLMARGPQNNPLLGISSQFPPPLLSSLAESQQQSMSEVHF